jgi:hypothetical protein
MWADFSFGRIDEIGPIFAIWTGVTLGELTEIGQIDEIGRIFAI